MPEWFLSPRDDRPALSPPSPLIDEDLLIVDAKLLSSTDYYVLCQALLGADMSEVVGSETVKRIASVTGELLSKDIMEAFFS